MKEKKEVIISLRLDEHHLSMLQYLIDKLETNKSNLLRTLIYVAYEKQQKKEYW